MKQEWVADMEMIKSIFHLSGYGIYVWPAFAVTFLVLVWMVVSTLRRLRKNEANLARLQKIRAEILANQAESDPPQ